MTSGVQGVCVWNSKDGKLELSSSIALNGNVHCVSFLPSSQDIFAACGVFDNIPFYSLATGKKCGSLVGNVLTSTTNVVVFNPRSKVLASGSEDGVVRVNLTSENEMNLRLSRNGTSRQEQ